MDAIEIILRLSDVFAVERQLTRRQVSWRVFGDTNNIDRLASGGDLTTRRHAQAMRWFSANWPEGLDWPADISRPDPHDPSPSPLSDDGENAAPTARRHVESGALLTHEAAR